MHEEQVAAAQRKTQPAHAQKRICLGRDRQERHRFIAADVERAHRHRSLRRHGGGDAAQGVGLLVFRRRLRAIKEEELRPQQPDRLGPVARRGSGFRSRRDVGGQFHPPAVAGVQRRRRTAIRGQRRGRLQPPLATRFQSMSGRLVGCDPDLARRAVEGHDGIGGDRSMQPRHVHSIDHPHPRAAEQDRGVAGGSDGFGEDAPHRLQIERGNLARQQRRHREDARCRWKTGPCRSDRTEFPQDAPAQILHVTRAFAQERLFKPAIPFRGRPADLLPRMRRGQTVVRDQAGGALDQRGIVGEHPVRFQDGRVLRTEPSRDVRRFLRQLPAHARQRLVEPG